MPIRRPAAHAILDGLDDTPRIINGVFRVQVTPRGRSLRRSP